jgi:hypothetical protein
VSIPHDIVDFPGDRGRKKRLPALFADPGRDILDDNDFISYPGNELSLSFNEFPFAEAALAGDHTIIASSSGCLTICQVQAYQL